MLFRNSVFKIQKYIVSPQSYYTLYHIQVFYCQTTAKIKNQQKQHINKVLKIRIINIFQNFILHKKKKHTTFETLFGAPSKSQLPVRLLIYKEVARDWLNDPLATLKKRRCQFLTKMHGAFWRYKLIR